jgi:hypothetical protein
MQFLVPPMPVPQSMINDVLSHLIISPRRPRKPGMEVSVWVIPVIFSETTQFPVTLKRAE